MALDKEHIQALGAAIERFKRGDRSTSVQLFSGAMEIFLTDRTVNILVLDKDHYTNLRRLLARLAAPNSITCSPGIVANTKLLAFIPR